MKTKITHLCLIYVRNRLEAKTCHSLWRMNIPMAASGVCLDASGVAKSPPSKVQLFLEGMLQIPKTVSNCPQVPVEIAVCLSQTKLVSKWQCGCYEN